MDFVRKNGDFVKVPLKPIVPIKYLDKIFRRRYVKNTQYYFTNRAHAQGKGKLDHDRLFIRPGSDKLLSYIKYSKRRTKLLTTHYRCAPTHMKYGQKFDKIKDLSESVYVPEPLDDIKSIVGIHPEFNTVISGRPLRTSDDIKVYIQTIRAYAMIRQQIGYRNDLSMRIQKNVSEELKEYENISEMVKIQLSNFQLFLLEDHKRVVAKLAKIEKFNAEVQVKNKEFLSIISYVTILNNIILKLDAVRNNLKTYRAYCLFVAPISWRQLYDETLRDRLQSIQFDSGVFSLDNDLMDCIDIDKTVEYAKIEFRNKLPPVLYFKTAQQMKYIFDGMELQSREYLTQLSRTGDSYRNLQRRVNLLKEATRQLDYFQYNIDYVINATEREDYNANYVRQKFFRTLNDTFYNTVASPETLKLKMCIEFVYEQVFSKCEEGHQSLYEPMTILEGLYDNYYLKLDALDFNIVKSAKREFFLQDLKYMKRAHIAQRELKAFKEMINALNRAFLPPAKFKILSTPLAALPCQKSIVLSNSVSVEKSFDLSEDDRDGLLFFTEWVEGTDPAPYLTIYRDQIKPCLNKAERRSAES